MLPPSETAPPPLSGLLAVTVSDEYCSMALVTPPVATLSVPLLVIGPPVNPAPLPTLVTVPVPGKVWPLTNVTSPLLFTSNTVPFTDRVGALPLGNRVSVLRMSLAPFTSRLAAGEVVPMPRSPAVL